VFEETPLRKAGKNYSRIRPEIQLTGINLALTTRYSETLEKCSILFKVKEGENSNHRNTLKYFED
jgi:hypothetical protein